MSNGNNNNRKEVIFVRERGKDEKPIWTRIGNVKTNISDLMGDCWL